MEDAGGGPGSLPRIYTDVFQLLKGIAKFLRLKTPNLAGRHDSRKLLKKGFFDRKSVTSQTSREINCSPDLNTLLHSVTHVDLPLFYSIDMYTCCHFKRLCRSFACLFVSCHNQLFNMIPTERKGFVRPYEYTMVWDFTHYIPVVPYTLGKFKWVQCLDYKTVH